MNILNIYFNFYYLGVYTYKNNYCILLGIIPLLQGKSMNHKNDFVNLNDHDNENLTNNNLSK